MKGQDLLPTYRDCLFCGPEHAFGLKLKLRHADGAVVTEFAVARSFQGYEETVHGGIVSGILDEVMWWAVTLGARQIAMTRKIEVEFLRPMRCEAVHTARGRLAEARHRAFHASGEIEDDSGRVIARGRGLFMPAKTVSGAELARKLDLTRLSPEMAGIFSALLG